MYLFVLGNFFRRRRPRGANDEMPATPLLEMLVFWVLFGVGVLLGSLATTTAMGGSMAPAIACACAALASLAGTVVMWWRLNR
jgi:hypothetical protein